MTYTTPALLSLHQVQLGISIENTASIHDLRQQLAEDCGIPATSLIITEVDGEGFHRTFAGGSPAAAACCIVAQYTALSYLVSCHSTI